MEEFVKVARVEEVLEGRLIESKASENLILLTRISGKIYAIGALCSHLKLSMAKGVIEGNVLICPHHGSEFDITTGANLKGPAKKPIQTYEVKIEGDDVFVKAVK